MKTQHWKRPVARRRGFTARPEREWVPLNGAPYAATVATSAVSLYGLQAPTITIGTDLVADPPQDVTVQRFVAELSVLSSVASSNCTLALLVADRFWTPNSNFVQDADKRLLWYRTYVNALTTGITGSLWEGATYSTSGVALYTGIPEDYTRIDIAPKVRIEAGKALHMVLYYTSGTWTVNLRTARMLLQKSGRR